LRTLPQQVRKIFRTLRQNSYQKPKCNDNQLFVLQNRTENYHQARHNSDACNCY